MKKFIKFLLLLFTTLFSLNSNASHMMGGDIAYECISPGKYKLVIKIYRDCRGIPFNSPSISILCKDGSNSIDLNYTRTAINDINPTCVTGTSPCNPTNQTVNSQDGGIEEHVFESIIDFNSNPYKALKDNGCCEIKIKVEQCCRNSAIDNISPGNFYTDAMINICEIGKKCNTSPQLTTPPVAYVCCNQPFTFNNGVKELIDGDSLSYDLVNPLNGNGSNENYTGQFNSQIPMTPFCPPNPGIINCRPLPNAKPPRGFYFDKETGDMIFTPVKCDETGVIVIQVTEWRKDSLGNWKIIGYTRRDMQIIVQTCPDNNPPQILSSKNKYSICEEGKICFRIQSKDEPFLPKQTRLDTTTMTWNYGIPGGTFTIIDPTAREKEAEFCWQTQIGDARPNAYTFTVTVRDDNCPKNALANKGFNIFVNPKARDIRKYEILDCGKLKFNAFPKDTISQSPSSYIYKYVIRDSTNSGVPLFYSFSKQDSFQFKKGGKYIIEHEINNKYNCPSFYKDTIIIPPVLEVKLTFGKDTFICSGDSLTIEPRIENGNPKYQYNWIFTPQPEKITLYDNKARIKINTNTIVSIKILDKSKCTDTDTILVKNILLPKVNIGPDKRICSYDSVILDAKHNDTMKYVWYPTLDNTRKITIKTKGKYIVRVIDTLGCFNSDTMQLFVNDTVIAFAGNDGEICIFDTLKLNGLHFPKKYIKIVSWRDINVGNIVSNDSIYRVKIGSLNPKKYEYHVKIIQNSLLCEGKDTINYLINALPTFKYNSIPPRCYKDGAINLTINNVATAYSGDKTKTEKDIKYFHNKKPSWITGGPVGINTFIYDYPKFILNSQVPKTGLQDSICYEYKDYKGCYNKECKLIKLNPNPIVDIVDKTHCQKAGLFTLENLIKFPSNRTGASQTFKCIEGPSTLDIPLNLLITTNNTTFPPTNDFDPGLETEPNRTGDYKIEYCFRDAITGCQSCDTSTITVLFLPEIQFENIPKLCINHPLLVLDSLVRDKITNKRFPNGEWKTIEFGFSRIPNNQILNSIKNKKYFDPSYGPGVFLIKFSDISSGCYVEDSLELIVNGLPKIELDIPDTICSSTPQFQLINKQPVGNVGKWSGEGVFNRDFNPSISPKNNKYEGYYKIRFDYTSPQTNCSNFSIDSLLIQSQPEIKILNSKPYQQCEWKNFTLNSSKKWCENILWKHNGDGFINNNQILNIIYKHGIEDTSTGIVNLIIQSIKEGICPIVEDSIHLIIEAYPQIDFIGDPLIQCEPGIVNFTSIINKPKNNLKYFWDFGNNGISTVPNPSNVIYDTANRNWYNVKLTVKNQWGDNDSQSCISYLYKPKYIKILPQPKANFTSEPNYFTTVAFPKVKFYNQTQIRWGKDSLTYLWNFNSKEVNDTSSKINPIHFYPEDTFTYNIRLISTFTYKEYQCIDSIIKQIKIGPDITVFVPNVFSPEKTGPKDNNIFRPVVNGEKEYFIQVFNRWGELLWESNNKYEGWDGKFKNIDCQQDVYVWVIKVRSYDEEIYQYEGTVTLLR